MGLGCDENVDLHPAVRRSYLSAVDELLTATDHHLRARLHDRPPPLPKGTNEVWLDHLDSAEEHCWRRCQLAALVRDSGWSWHDVSG